MSKALEAIEQFFENERLGEDRRPIMASLDGVGSQVLLFSAEYTAAAQWKADADKSLGHQVTSAALYVHLKYLEHEKRQFAAFMDSLVRVGLLDTYDLARKGIIQKTGLEDGIPIGG